MKYVILFLGVLITGVSLAQDHSLDCRITGAQNIDVYLADFMVIKIICSIRFMLILLGPFISN